MADGQELHQIEYRHHETKDLSPVASSMSAESRRGWDSQIRPWVRQPDAAGLSESACYQLLANGQAALAWRYWDQRAVERGDGTRGRALVSRVLVGQASVLTPDLATVLCQAGPTADTVGPLPGEVPYDAKLPTVGRDALDAVTRAMTPVLEQEAVKQAGLQAVVAAALADPHAPLAISVPDHLIQTPLPGVQCPLLWGVRRIAGPLLGPVGRRGWSFSTFEPPLGVLDPVSLPGIVFRQAQDGGTTPGGRWRREVRVSPLAANALEAGTFYADYVELAGWLIAEYSERGGDGLERFIADCCGSEGSLLMRCERIHRKLSKPESPMLSSSEPTPFISVRGDRAGTHEDPESTGLGREETERDSAAADAAPLDVAAESSRLDAPESDSGAPVRADEEAGRPQADPALAAAAAPYPDQHKQDGDQYKEYRQIVSPQAARGFAPIRPPMIVSGFDGSLPHEDQGSWSGAFQPAAKVDDATVDEGKRPPGPSTEGQTRSERPVTDRSGEQAAAGSRVRQVERHQSAQPPSTVSRLLERLELTRHDAAEFQSTLERISRVGSQSNDPTDRVKSWDIIRSKDWYSNIDADRAFSLDELTEIFRIVVIPELAGRDTGEGIARAAEGVVNWAAIATWAADAQPLMIGGLLAAARQASPDVWQAVMGILEPVIAVRWVADHSIQEQWDTRRAVRSTAEFGRDDSKRGLNNLFRRR
jgi:hypothetical protein